MAIDILFIHPGNQKKTYQDLSKEYTAVATPAWTLLLAGYLREKGYDVAIYDANAKGWDENIAKDTLTIYNPQIVVIMVYGHNPSASTQTMPAAGKIAKDLKRYNKDIPIAMGGIHPSALPEMTLIEEDIDFVIKGEGAYTLEGLIKYQKGKCKINDVKGLYYKKNGNILNNEPSSIINDLDTELIGYPWDLLSDLNLYRAHNMHCFQDFEKSKKVDFSDIRTPYVAMNTSLGCPYSCSYCCINAIFGRPRIRYWSEERVVSWLDELVNKYCVRNIRFDDELFILSPKRVERLCDMIIERGYDLNIWVYGRVDTIREKILPKLKKAGINWICLGIESGNDRVRGSVNKNIKKDIKDIVRAIQAHGIYVHGNFMFGLPEDKMQTMNETLELAMELNCEFANFYSVMAYPGSALYQYAVENGWEIPENWDGFSQLGYETMPLPTKYLTAKEVLSFRDKAFYKYHSNPRYLNMIAEKFGSKTKKHIEKMLEVKLKRRLLGD